MPVVVPLIVGAVVAGTATSVVGQIKAGNAAKRAGEAQGELGEYNAAIADLQATDAATRGAEEESRFRSQVRGLIGSQRAGFAGQNVLVGSGSAADVQADSAYLGELDARQIRANAQREVWGFQVQAEDLRRGAQLARQTGQAAQTASRWGAGSTVLGASSSLLLMRYGWDQQNKPRGA